MLTEKQPKISILVPCYNVEKYLPQCLDSIVNQTLKDIEIIVINDGSTDSTLNIIKDYASKDKRIKIIDKENEGYGKSMNRGLDVTTGEYVGIVESDDWVEPDFLETLLRPFDEIPGIEISICGWYWHRDGKTTLGAQQSLGLMDSKQATRAALDHSRGFHGYLWNKLFRSSLPLHIDEDVSVCEDLLLCVKLLHGGAAAYDSGEPLYHYRYRESGALRTIDEKRLSEFTARERIAALLQSNAPLYRAAALAEVKAALNLLAEAKETGNEPLRQAMQTRIDARLPMLLHAKDLSRKERIKLRIRRAFPKTSLRIFRRLRRDGGVYEANL